MHAGDEFKFESDPVLRVLVLPSVGDDHTMPPHVYVRRIPIRTDACSLEHMLIIFNKPNSATDDEFEFGNRQKRLERRGGCPPDELAHFGTQHGRRSTPGEAEKRP